MKTLISNNMNSLDLENHIQVKNIDSDVIALVDKYAKDKKNISSYSDALEAKEGFFLLWIKKDLNAPKDEQLKITTFAQSIHTNDVRDVMNSIIGNIEIEQNITNFA